SIKLLDGQIPQILQQPDVGSRERAGASIDEAQRPNAASVGEEQRTTGIKAYPWFVDYQRIVGKSRIHQSIRHQHGFTVIDDVAAKGDIPWGLSGANAVAGLEPLPVLVYEADEGDRHVKHRSGETRDSIESLFWIRIEDSELAKGRQAAVFVFRNGSFHPVTSGS